MTEASETTIHPELVNDALSIVDVRDKVAATDILAAAQLTAEQVHSITITDDLSYVNAGEALKSLKGVQRRLEGVRTSMKAPVLEAGRKIDGFFKAPSILLEGAERVLKARIGAYATELERKRREAEDAARRERERVERERAEAARREAEERARTIANARSADDLLVARQVPPPAPVAPVPDRPVAHVTKLAGVSTRKVIKSRVVNLRAVIDAAAAGHVEALALLSVDPAQLALLTRSRGLALAVPGIETFEEDVVSARSA